MKIFIVYDSKYGNTKTAAENILNGIKQTEGIEVDFGYIKEVNLQNLLSYDALIIGAPNHMARPSQTIQKFIDRLAKLNLKTKYVAVFGTYSGRTRLVDRAVKKMEKNVETKLPNTKLLSPSLSIRVKGVTGPLVEGELPKCVDFGRRIASQLRQTLI